MSNLLHEAQNTFVHFVALLRAAFGFLLEERQQFAEF